MECIRHVRHATAFNVDIGAWDTPSVIYTQFMFTRATNFNGDVGKWNIRYFRCYGYAEHVLWRSIVTSGEHPPREDVGVSNNVTENLHKGSSYNSSNKQQQQHLNSV